MRKLPNLPTDSNGDGREKPAPPPPPPPVNRGDVPPPTGEPTIRQRSER